MLKRFVATITAVAMTLPLLGVPMAQADSVTGPWTWTDLSNQLTERQNRPIWAVAYANGSWFYTDGQNLWNGGQAYRYDGFTQVNITTDVRNAGIERVDDIVSDGQTVLFLQDVVRLDNQLKVVAYRNGSYMNITNAVRNVLNSNEGISSINGKNGTWYIVTTQARLFRWDGSSNNPSQISLPGGISNVVDSSPSAMVYNVNHGSPVNGFGRIPLAMVPLTNNQWLLAGDPTNGYVRVYRYDGSSFSDITSTVLPNADTVTKIASNGTAAIISGYANGTKNRLTDGSNAYDISNLGNLSDALIGWNGRSWMIVQTKNLSRISGSFTNQSAEGYGRTGDRIIGVAGDTNGRFLVGGALSTVNMDDPSFPLTAKLVMVSEGVTPPNSNTGSSGDRVYTSSFGPRVVVQGDPSNLRVGNGYEFAYRVTATDSNGIDRTEIYVNDARIKTCTNTDYCEFRTTYFTNNASSRSVKFYVRSTDKNGYTTDSSSSPDYLTVDMGTSSAGQGNNNQGSDANSGINTWTWLEPNTTTLADNQNVTFNVGSQDANGIKRVEIYVNGSIVRTCDFNNATGNQNCSSTLYANNYGAGTSVFVNAKVTDGNNNMAWTNSTTLSRSGTSSGGNQNGAMSVWSFFDQTGDLQRGNTTQFRAEAWAERGLNSIELWVNGSIRRTCTFNGVTGNQTCDTTVYGNDYTAGSTITANAKAIDRDGRTVWSDARSINIVNNTTTNPPTTSGNNIPAVWEWIEPSVSSINANNSVMYAVGAWDADGVRSIAVWVNGSNWRTCDFNPGYGNQECRVQIGGSSFSAGSNVFVNAVAKDANGNVAWTQGKTLNVTGTGSVTPGNGGTNIGGSVSITSNPQNTYRSNDVITFTTSGSDADGVNRVDIYVNALKVKTCTGTASCTVSMGPFSGRSVVTYGAVLTDNGGNAVTSGFKQLFRE